MGRRDIAVIVPAFDYLIQAGIVINPGKFAKLFFRVEFLTHYQKHISL